MTFQVEFATQPKILNVEFDTALNISGGYDDGYNDGFTTGKEEGLTEGEAIGIAKGGKIALQEFMDARGGLVKLCYNGMLKYDAAVWLLSKVDTSKYTDANNMFYGCSWAKFPLCDTSGVKDASSMFSMCQGTTEYMPNYDFRNVENFYETFRNMTQTVSLPDLETPNATNTSGMYWGCGKLTRAPRLDTSKVTNMNSMFYGCTKIPSVPQYDTSAVKYCNAMFRDCKSLESLPSFDFSKVTSIENWAYNCTNLITVGKIDFSSATTVNYIFRECPKLESADVDIRSASITNAIFGNCTNLTNIKVRNIKCSLAVGSGTTYGHLLTLDSLIGLCYELRATSSQKTLTMGSANLEKLANVYVREIPITDAMREADDLIDEKLPFEVCDSTADGATLITDYVLLKNWKLA